MLIPLQLEREGRTVAAGFAAAFRSELESLDLEGIFSLPERVFIERLRYPARRESFVLGRIAAKRAVIAARRPELIDATQFEIRKGVFEQPIVFPFPVELSIAHSGGAAVALACESGHPVGLDLELAMRTRPDFLEESFTAGERTFIAGRAGTIEENYCLAWTIKEALAKILRTGLTTPFRVLEFAPDSGRAEAPIQVTFSNFTQYKAMAWRIAQFSLAIALPRKTELQIVLGPEIVERFARL